MQWNTTKNRTLKKLRTVVVPSSAVFCVCSLDLRWTCWSYSLSKKHPLSPGYLDPRPPVRPEIELASMDFTVLNITQTRLSAKWDLLIRVPYNLPDSYICLNGDVQASLFYKNFTIATSSRQKYSGLQYQSAQLLRVSAVVSDKDISGLIGKDLTEDVKEKKEVRFGSRVFLTDCRKNRAEFMGFRCHEEATLRFQPESEMRATMFGKH